MEDRIPELPRPLVLDRDYWLCRCEGFRVHDEDRRLGVVAEIHYRSRHDLPDELVVYGGLFGNRVMLVPVADVLEIVPGELRIVVSTPASEPEPPLLARLRGTFAHAVAAVHMPG